MIHHVFFFFCEAQYASVYLSMHHVLCTSRWFHAFSIVIVNACLKKGHRRDRGSDPCGFIRTTNAGTQLIDAHCHSRCVQTCIPKWVLLTLMLSKPEDPEACADVSAGIFSEEAA